MNTPSSNVGSQIKAAAAADATKAQAWLGNNWYPFGIGVASSALLIKVAHLVGFLKFL
jgi:hypothetical protein